ncbi:MAG: NifB/NifX family molybdenum-iron cluster-binding protein [Eubacterium sp.]|nr:NifB/NifX family molybdenum-iron cluster-binding protein [Eubacterium sp.]MCI2198040.1 NifB/NifX family molybdenum-iron cluster-binding protein [Eubacterium sp.]
MKIAAAYDVNNGSIFQHFGRTEAFKVYDVQDGKIISSKVESTNGRGHGELAGVLTDLGVSTLICGGLGAGAQEHLKNSNIYFFGGVSGSADQAVQDYLDGKLQYNPDVKCSGHHDHGEGEHHCGGHHDHGEHHCGGHGHGGCHGKGMDHNC